ncbi:MAG: TonB-dependent receptor [Acidobacteriia bacterium]|nr:TonB-dependent receptor [Terriglobia bacterium]
MHSRSFSNLARILFSLIVLALPATALAQAGSGELTGEVRDPSEELVPNAQVTLTQLQTGLTYSSTTTSGGVYVFSSLKPGRYSLSVEATGFKRFTQEDFNIATGERVHIDVTLTIGSIAESVTVKAEVSPLRTESATMGQVISNETIMALPLNGRNFMSLAGLAAGVALPPAATPLPRLNGSRPRTNEYMYDGISVLQPEPGQIAFVPIIDAIQEFNMQTNDASAEFGRFNGGVINLSTKSGANQFHGSAFEFLRNEALNARNLFAPATAVNPRKPEFRRNQFGFVVGGPIVHDKTFFFLDYQGTRQLIGRVVTSTVPTLAERGGDFSALLSSPYYVTPSGAVTTTSTGNTPLNTTDTNGNTIQVRQGMIFRPSDHRAYAGNFIPVTSFDAVAASLLNLYPQPTSSGAANNFSRIGNEPDTADQFDIRIDHRFSSSDQVFGRYSFAKDFTQPVTPLPNGYGNTTTGASTGPQNTLGQSLASNYLHVFSPTLTNEVRAGYTRRSINRQGLLMSQTPSQGLNLPGIPTNGAFNNELPTFLVSGFQQLGPQSNVNSIFRTDVIEIADTVSYLHGRHAIRFGIDNRISRLDVIQPPSPTGSFTFNTLFTNFTNPSGVTGSTNTGNSLASFLLGQVQSFSIDLQEKVLRPRAWFQEWFVQDNWKATSRLTLTGGVRYTLNFPSTEVDNQGAVFNLQTQQLQYLGQNGFPRSARTLHWKNLGPRVGIAYRLTNKTVIRSGYAIVFFDQSGITTPFTNPAFPFVQTVTQSNLNNTTPAFVLANGPTVQPIPLTPDAGLGLSVYSADRTLGSGYVQQWNLAIQRELTHNLTFEIAYTGSKATHLGVPDYNLNQLTAAQLALGSPLQQSVPNPFAGQIPSNPSLNGPTIPQGQLLKPFPRFQNVILYRNNIGNSNYNGVQVKLEKRFAHGSTLLASYTHSKLIDDASSVFDASIGLGSVANFPVADSYNRKLERGVSTGDIPNVTVISYTYDLPIGPNHRFHPGGAAGKFASGWQVAGIISLESGLPLAVTQTTNFNAFAGFATQRPNCVADTALPASQRSVSQFFNVSAFQTAPVFTLGTCSRNPIRGPAYRDADLALIKRTDINERMSVDFRAEIFNLTNTPPLGAPNVTKGSSAFGSITSAGDPRVVQLALKFNF